MHAIQQKLHLVWRSCRWPSAFTCYQQMVWWSGWCHLCGCHIKINTNHCNQKATEWSGTIWNVQRHRTLLGSNSRQWKENFAAFYGPLNLAAKLSLPPLFLHVHSPVLGFLQPRFISVPSSVGPPQMAELQWKKSHCLQLAACLPCNWHPTSSRFEPGVWFERIQPDHATGILAIRLNSVESRLRKPPGLLEGISTTRIRYAAPRKPQEKSSFRHDESRNFSHPCFQLSLFAPRVLDSLAWQD